MEWLTKAEREALEAEYLPWEDAAHARRRILAEVFRPAPQVFALSSFLLDQLSTDDLGLPWLGGSDVNRRILLSDYAFAAAETIEVSLLEAVLALRSWRHLREGNAGDELERRYTKIDSVTAADEVALVQAEREFSSVFVSLGSALDRTMIVAAVICGLEVGVRRLGWGLGSTTAKKVLDANDPPEVATVLSQVRIASADADFGPPGWLGWTLSMRNNFVHRPRRIVFSPSRDELCVPRDPDMTDVEAASSEMDLNGLLLTENAVNAVAGVVVSTVDLVEHVCRELVAIGIARASGDLEIEQPLEIQWAANGAHSGFEGYAPGSLDVAGILQGNAIQVAPAVGYRFRAAGLFDDQRRAVWGEWSA